MNDARMSHDPPTMQVIPCDPWRRLVDDLRERFADDPLYRTLVPEDQVLIWTDDFVTWQRGNCSPQERLHNSSTA